MRRKLLFIGVLTALACVCLAGCGQGKIEKNESSEIVSTEMRSEEEKTDDVVNESEDMTESDESVSDTDYVDVSGITHPFGSINGVELTDQVNDFNSTFGADGFTFHIDSTGKYNTQGILENEKYPDLTAFITSKSEDNGTNESFQKDGFYGYSVAGEGRAEKKPDMEWGGLTWGASEDDIKAVYGEPTYRFDSDMYDVLEYRCSDTTTLRFDVYHEGAEFVSYAGLQDVELLVYDTSWVDEIEKPLRDALDKNSTSVDE